MSGRHRVVVDSAGKKLTSEMRLRNGLRYFLSDIPTFREFGVDGYLLFEVDDRLFEVEVKVREVGT